MKKALIGILGILLIVSCTSKLDTGVVGTVEYGEGDCGMPVIDDLTREYGSYSGRLYFVEISKLYHFDSDDFEQLKKTSRSTKVRSGKFKMELPPATFVVMPEEFFTDTRHNTITILPDEFISKDFRFWKCTSY